MTLWCGWAAACGVRGWSTRSPRCAPAMVVALALAAAFALFGRTARADLPGTVPLAAAGDGHLWWVVKVEPPADRTRGTSVAAPPTWALMHHAVDEPSPTERLVMRFGSEPAAIAASGQRVVVLTRGERGAGLFVTTMFAVKNEAVGHWFTMPRGMPIVLPEPPVDGDVRAAAVFGDTLALLVRLRRVEPRAADRFWLGTVECESGVGSAWTERPLPGFEFAEPVRLFARGDELVALGADAEAPVRRGSLALARWSGGAWVAERIERGGAPVPSRGVLGGFAVANRTVIVERGPAGPAVTASANHAVTAEVAPGAGAPDDGASAEPASGAPASGSEGKADAARIRVSLLRDGRLQPWVDFAEPEQAWFAGPFGAGATVLTLGGGAGAGEAPAGRAYASLRGLSFASSEPGPEQSLAPPGFASGSWIHMPIIGVLSVALVLAAVIFGSDAYLASRMSKVSSAGGAAAEAPQDAPPVRTVRGASLGRRGAALLLDMLPGMVFVWFFVRGTPFDLLQIPAFQPDLRQGVPSLIVFGAGWLVASLGDVLFGRSMGKRIVGLRIISARGGPAPVGRRILRALASSIAVASPVVMLLAFLHPRGDGPAEMLTGTAVVDEAEADGELASRRTGGGQNRPE